MVTIFETLTMDGLGNPASFKSAGERKNSSSPISFGICDVTAAKIMSGLLRLNRSDETTRAGLILVVVKSVKGKETRTMSPLLKGVINGVLRIVPKREGFLRGFQTSHVVAF